MYSFKHFSESKFEPPCILIQFAKIQVNNNLSMYAATEIGPAPFHTPWTTDIELLSETVGKPPVTIDFKYRIRHLIEERYCSIGEEGEIECLSPLRMANYWHHRHLPKMGWVSQLYLFSPA